MVSYNSTPAQVAILAGGLGTRLKSRTGDMPKPMVPLLGVPVLERLILLCKVHGFKNIVLLIHYASDQIQAYFGDGSAFGVQIEYCIEQDARGTAGALRDALGYLDTRFLVLYGDTFADVDLRAIWDRHASSDAAATLLLHPNDHPNDSDLVELDSNQNVVAIHPYPHRNDLLHHNIVNAALYVFERETLSDLIPVSGKFDIAKHTFPAMLTAGMRLQGYLTPEYIKDIGTPERLDKVARDITSGLPDKLANRQLRSAVFLDRDGTLNVEVNHLRDPAQLALITNAGQAVHLLNRSGLLAICITNQPVVARGEASLDDIDHIHAALDRELGKNSSYIDGLYFCPHHPDKGFVGEVQELKITCDCRKPRTGMIDQAIRDFGIDRRHSWMVGDATGDIEAGRRAGLRTILVRTGHAGLDRKYKTKPDYIMPDLMAASEWIVAGHAAMTLQMLGVCAAAAGERLILIGGPSRVGKSSAAQIVAELMAAAGRHTHIISLDGWLKPTSARTEGAGVSKRYDMERASRLILPLLESENRHWIDIPEYDRISRSIEFLSTRSIGPDDLIIVEGVTALADSSLLERASVRVFVDTNDDKRRCRVRDEYRWRGKNDEEIELLIESREIDEVPFVKQTAVHATHLINS